MQMDLQDIQEFDARDRYGVRHSWRGTASPGQQYFINQGREAKRKRSRRAKEEDITNFTDNNLIHKVADSLGHVRTLRRVVSKIRRTSQVRSTL
ncbi:hypothetical protein BU23DRAFT_293118 [Bimuria novae-zelandiae CBS 107.79]|uniref:Uncharacterized protein n=1 Tax=Bimuria novae-zelandiae CBS 107.79 TaxID=1447943 RepID=A0A6A5UU65_9PLEO|nr:hypothetical protein BU23DRAFT_293118 [Bimuria novae-zelandiae CBS 107.79]